MMTAKTDLPFAKIGLGCVTFGREINEDASFAMMDYAVQHGITFFDTAEAYGDGASERIIGNWLRSRGMRERITVETKITRGFTRTHMREALERSLERLGLDCVDVYMLHSLHSSVPIKETLDALTSVIAEGKVRFAGCSNLSAAQLSNSLAVSAAYGLARFDVIQPIFNLAERASENDLLPLAQSEGVMVVSYSPLGAGFLSGKYTPDRAAIPAGSRFGIKPGHANIYFKPHHFETVERLRKLAAETGLPMTRLAMSWVLQNLNIDCVLVGGRSTEHLAHAIEALRAGISPELKTQMDSWPAPAAAAGESPSS
jgi:1-deoxyxylulose-5-phosphate synthase